MAGGAQFDPASDDIAETHEINVTPFIDVMLVLLIIFMVAAPLATVDVKVDLPKVVATAEAKPDKPLYLTLRADLSLTLGNSDVSRDILGSSLDRLTAGDPETRLYLRADRSVDYGALMDLMNDLRRAGYRKVALVGLDGGSPPPTARREEAPVAQ